MLKRVLGDLVVIAVGIVILALPFYIMEGEGCNPYNNYRLIRYGKVTRGVVVSSWDDLVEREDGDRAGWKHYCTYRFTTSSGQIITNSCSVSSELSGGIEIEYLPANPNISRVKGTGYTTMKELYWRGVAGGVFFLLFFAVAGSIIKTGVVSLLRSIKRPPEAPSE